MATTTSTSALYHVKNTKAFHFPNVGYPVSIFLDPDKISQYWLVCPLCDNVCQECVALTCCKKWVSEDKTSPNYCGYCLSQFIGKNGGQCHLYDEHFADYEPNEFARRHIINMKVQCVRSTAYQLW